MSFPIINNQNTIMLRQSNFELLRIIAIAMIIGLHYFYSEFGGAMAHLHFPQYNFFIANILESMFIVAVNCFILIMGYFQIEKDTFKIKKVFNLLLTTLFYALLLYLVAVLFKLAPFSIPELERALLPFFYGQYWFIEIYLILYLLSPFLNLGLNRMDEKTYKIFLAIILLLFSLWPSFLAGSGNLDNGYGVISFIMLYTVGGYIKKYYQVRYSAKFYLFGYILFSLVTFSFRANPTLLGSANAWNYNFIFNILSSVCLFLFFSKFQLQSKIINYLASFVFGAYLIHTNPYIGRFIYLKILHTDYYWSSPLFFLHLIISIIFIYVGATIIDIGRAWIFKRVKI